MLLLFIPFRVRAYGIENYFIDATVESNGDLLVQEYFNMTGEYNGSVREINYKNDSSYLFNPNMDSLVTIGVLASFIYSFINLILIIYAAIF